MKPSVSDVLEVNIEDLGHQGEGIGKYKDFTIFVPGALPQEIVKVKIETVKQKFAIGNLLEIVKPSQNRIKPPCPYFEKCGGCQIMHLSYETQLLFKKKRILDAFVRIANYKNLNDIVIHPSNPSFSYRNKIQLPAGQNQERIALGLYARNTHEIVYHDKCLIHSELGEKVYQKVLALLQEHQVTGYDEGKKTGELRHLLIRTALFNKEVLVTFITVERPSVVLKQIAQLLCEEVEEVKGVMHHKNSKDANFVFDKDFTLLAGRSFIEEKLSNLTFKVSAASFFQVNPFQAQNLYQRALEFANLSPEMLVIDAYCGIGTLSLLAAQKVKKVIGIECVNQAILDARENATLNKIHNAKFITAKVEEEILKYQNIDVIFLNPPRKGCEETVLKAVRKIKPSVLIYISCDPATLARDAKILLELGYSIETVEGFDMFPQTMHVETLVKFTIS